MRQVRFWNVPTVLSGVAVELFRVHGYYLVHIKLRNCGKHPSVALSVVKLDQCMSSILKIEFRTVGRECLK